jgi:hypothetical protein
MASLDGLAIFLFCNGFSPENRERLHMAGHIAVRIAQIKSPPSDEGGDRNESGGGLRSACGTGLQVCDFGLQLTDTVLCLKKQLRSIRANTVRHGMSGPSRDVVLCQVSDLVYQRVVLLPETLVRIQQRGEQFFRFRVTRQLLGDHSAM